MVAREIHLSERQQGAVVGLLEFLHFALRVGVPILVLVLTGMYAEEGSIPAWQIVVIVALSTVLGWGYVLFKRMRSERRWRAVACSNAEEL